MTQGMDVRRLTDRGVEAFRNYLSDLRRDPSLAPPRPLLTDPATATAVGGGRVEEREFQTRLDLAQYLDSALAGIESEAMEADVHLWSWLSIFFFDQVCPAGKDGARRPGRDYRHILEPGYPYGHRHLLAGAYLVYSVYGLDEGPAGLLLGTPPGVESKIYHELAVRLNLITNQGVMEAAFRLYHDPETARPKHGAEGRRDVPGSLHRFIAVVQQLDVTYDLYSMSGEEILGLLPAEFDAWRGI